MYVFFRIEVFFRIVNTYRGWATMEKEILNYIKPYIFHDNKMLKKDFDSIFGRFSKEELLKIREILEKNNIDVNIEKSQGELSNTEEDLNISNEKLCYLYQQGDSKALDILIERNERLVYSRVMKYYRANRHGLSIDDLFQEGCIGMIKAAKKFDIDLGFKFSTYAINWIDQSISRSIADKGFNIRVPVHMFDNVNKFRKMYRELEMDQDIDDEKLKILMENTGFKPEQIENIQKVARNILNMSSLNIKVGDGEDTELISFLEADETNNPLDLVTKSIMNEKIEEALESLTEREREVIILRFGLLDNSPKTLEEIGDIYGLTRERIRQIEKKSLVKLRKSNGTKKLKEFLYK